MCSGFSFFQCWHTIHITVNVQYTDCSVAIITNMELNFVLLLYRNMCIKKFKQENYLMQFIIINFMNFRTFTDLLLLKLSNFVHLVMSRFHCNQ